MKILDVTIELSNICNYKCNMCFLRQKDVISEQFIKKEYVERLLNDLENSEYRIHVLKTFWAGEGMLHPQFKDIISLLCNSRKIDMIAFDSNASVMKEDISQFLADMSKKKDLRIIFSLDAVNSEMYSKIRKGGDFNTTLTNIRNILKIIKKTENSSIKILIQFIVHPQNHFVLKEFMDFWKKEFLPELDFNIYLNQSIAVGNGVNIRPLTIQDESMGLNQSEANELFENALKISGIIKETDFVHSLSQGGGIINISNGKNYE